MVGSGGSWFGQDAPPPYRLREQDFGGGDAGYYYGGGGGGDGPGGGGQRGGFGRGNTIQYLEQCAEERKRPRPEQDRIDDGGREQLGEDAGVSSGVLCGNERGGLYAVMAGVGPAGRTIG